MACSANKAVAELSQHVVRRLREFIPTLEASKEEDLKALFGNLWTEEESKLIKKLNSELIELDEFQDEEPNIGNREFALRNFKKLIARLEACHKKILAGELYEVVEKFDEFEIWPAISKSQQKQIPFYATLWFIATGVSVVLIATAVTIYVVLRKKSQLNPEKTGKV